jgi:hypothetical protein
MPAEKRDAWTKYRFIADIGRFTLHNYFCLALSHMQPAHSLKCTV